MLMHAPTCPEAEIVKSSLVVIHASVSANNWLILSAARLYDITSVTFILIVNVS